jgi:alkylation response protein AidB-like acyl-CoA dehydrogenase
MSRIIDRRDQQFVLFEMLGVQDLFATEKYREFSRETFDMMLEMAQKISEEEVLPRYMEGDREGARLVNGEAKVPRCYHDLQKVMVEGGWFTMSAPPDAGGQGLPYIIEKAVQEHFIFNMAYYMYSGAGIGAAQLIEKYGTEEQKRKYMYKMFSCEWGGTMVLTEPEAGSDVGALKTKAVRQPDGSFRIFGSKIFISGGDHDLVTNIVHPVLARIEGDPAGTAGISIFLVPKYLVNADGTTGRRNDYSITGIEHKMGLKGNATCAMSFGDNGDCYAELLGEERQGMKIMFNMMNEERINMGVQGVGTASAAYLHALNYAKERVQGKALKDMANPDAASVPIIKHADVRRMLLWMKSHVEGMRALVYLCAYAIDRKHSFEGGEADKWHGIMELLVPITKAYCTDMGFRVTEQAIQCYGGYGFCQDYPVEQFMRDLKIGSIYEGTNGIQSLDLVGRKLGQRKGKDFMNFLGEMGATVARYGGAPELAGLAKEVQDAVNLLAEMGMYFAQCGKEGKFMVPVGNAYPFLMLMGTVSMAWLLFWQAGIAQEKLSAVLKEAGVDAADGKAVRAFLREHRDGAFYQGKIIAAEYYISHMLPEAHARAKAIKSENLGFISILDESFAAQ